MEIFSSGKLKQILLFFPVGLFIGMIGFFVYFSLSYKLIVDDFQFQTVMKEQHFSEAPLFFYNNFNGRMASHIFLCSIFKIFQNKEHLFFIYHFAMLSGFIYSLAYCLKNYLKTFRNKSIQFTTSLKWSCFIASFLFFFFFAGRIELWFWISATGVYLISLLIALNGFAIVFREKQNYLTACASFILFFLVGGFSESFAVIYFIILSLLLVFALRKKSFLKSNLLAISVGLIGLSVALIINISSTGIQNRLGWLPEFRIQQSILNTLHSLAFPILRYKHLPFVIGLLFIFLIYCRVNFPTIQKAKNTFLKEGTFVLVLIAISFSIPSYILSDIVPDRAASLGYLMGVLFLFDFFIFRRDSFLIKRFC